MEELDIFKQRKEKSEKSIIIGAILLILGIALFVLLQNIMVLGIIIALPGIVLLAIGFTKFQKLSDEFKVKVMKKLIEDLIEDGVYNPKFGLSMSQVYSSEFVRRADRDHTEDYISGVMDGVKFESSDVKLEEKHVRHTKNGTQTTWETYFLGRIFIFDFNKRFDGYIQVLENNRPHSNRKFKKVKLESVAFNKKFNTYSTSEHSAFYVLTPHFMEALMNFEKNNRGKIYFSFIDNLLYIGINNMRDTFELRMFKTLDQRTLDEFKNELLVIKDVIHELKLNNKLFMKEWF